MASLQGRQYNWEGNVKNWWNPATLDRFAEKAKCFAQQYGALKESQTGESLNGNLTLGENIADNGGLKIAKEAYDLWRKRSLAEGDEEPHLPGFHSSSADQVSSTGCPQSPAPPHSPTRLPSDGGTQPEPEPEPPAQGSGRQPPPSLRE